jgi:hypothetical protein
MAESRASTSLSSPPCSKEEASDLNGGMAEVFFLNISP